MSTHAMRSIEIFCSCASQDSEWLTELKQRLSGPWWESNNTRWHDEILSPGTVPQQVIPGRLEKAHIILLLISQDFINSDEHMERVNTAIQKHKSTDARAIYILLRPIALANLPVGPDILPLNGTPIKQWRNREEALVQVENWIRREVNYWSDRFHKAKPTTKVPERIKKMFEEQNEVDALKKVHNNLHNLHAELLELKRILKESERNELNIKGISNQWSKISDMIDKIPQIFSQAQVKNSEEFLEVSLIWTSDFPWPSMSGSEWLKSLVSFRVNFNDSLDEESVQGMKNFSEELLNVCRDYLHKIDGDLLEAINQVDQTLDEILEEYTL
jgi:hypothetical protein